MLMHERFLTQIGGRHFHPIISVSPILHQLLTIMSDTQAFPFFSRGHLLQMLTCHGTTHVNRNTNRRIMHLILGRIVYKIASTPMVVSCFERCSIALRTYPDSIPRSPLYVEISDENIFEEKTIWQILSLCTILPEAKAILDISSEYLFPIQMKTYDKLYMITIFCTWSKRVVGVNFPKFL